MLPAGPLLRERRLGGGTSGATCRRRRLQGKVAAGDAGGAARRVRRVGRGGQRRGRAAAKAER